MSQVKTRSLGQIVEKPCVRSRGHIFSPILLKLVRMFALIKSRTSSKLGHVRSEASALGQILEKPCVYSRGYIFSSILMKIGQNVCLDKISDEFENGSCRVKNQVTRSNLRKTLCMLQRPHFSSDTHEPWS